MKVVSVVCAHCSISFEKLAKNVTYSEKHNRKHCCSVECGHQLKSTTIEVPCGTCGTLVKREPSQLKKSKSGYLFCTKSCAVTYNNRILRTGTNHPNYGVNPITGEPATTNYRTTCFAHHEKKCVVCGEDKIVEVHHMDENHENSDPTNLIPLCPTHHKYWHSRWRYLIEEKVRSYHEQLFESLPMLDNFEIEYSVEEVG